MFDRSRSEWRCNQLTSTTELKKQRDQVRLEIRRARSRKYYQDNADEINRKRYRKKTKQKKVKTQKKKRHYTKRKVKYVILRMLYRGSTIKYRVLESKFDQVTELLAKRNVEATQAILESKRCARCGRLP